MAEVWQPSTPLGVGQSDVVDEHGQASPVIGWNDLHILYQLPDGSKWAEHGSLYDSEDLVSCHVPPLLITVHQLSLSVRSLQTKHLQHWRTLGLTVVYVAGSATYIL